MNAKFARAEWLVTLGSTLALMVSSAPAFFFTFGIFLKPISEEYGWSRGSMSLGLSIGAILNGLATPFIGLMIDRWSNQRITLIMITLFAASFGLFYFAPANVASFIALYAFMGVLSSGSGPLPFAKAISGWFEQNRGLALGMAMAGVGVGIAIMPQVARLLLVRFGWRAAYPILGLIVWLVAFPAVFFWVKDPVVERDAVGGPAAKVRSGMDVSAAIRGKDFWLITAASFCVVTALTGIATHLIALLTDRGSTAVFAASMLTVVGLATIAGRLLSGFLLDRTFAPYLSAVIFVLPLVGIAILLAKLSAPLYVLVAATSFGLGIGAEVDIIGFLVGRYFGLRRYGVIYGYIFACFSIGSGVGPFVMGTLFDRTGSYNTGLTIFGGALLVSAALIAALGAYPYPAQHATEAPSGRTVPPLPASGPYAELE